MIKVNIKFFKILLKNKENWDSVVTCFFLDTANNVIEYIETIYHILKPGGVWINFGPLLYHYEDMKNEHSIELSVEEIKDLAQRIGFVIEVNHFSYFLYSFREMKKSPATIQQIRNLC